MIDEFGNNVPQQRELPLRKIAISGIVTLFLLFIGLWMYNHAFIEITVASGSAGEITYQLTNQSSHKSSQTSSTEKTVKKLVSRSSYQVLVQQGNLNHFSVVKTTGFLATTHIDATMQSEKSRQFVGDNPASCMNMVQQVLVSYVCSDLYSNAQIHVPATASQPTYKLKNTQDVADGYIEGMAQTSQGTLALIHTPEDTELGQRHLIYFVGPDLRVDRTVQLNGVDNSSTYTMAPYNNGFVLYGSDYGDILYYSTVSSRPQHITVASPSNTDLQPVSADFYNNRYAVLYSNNEKAKAGSILSVAKGGKTSQYSFPNNYSKVRLCGTNKVCLLGGRAMDVYALSDDKTDYLYSVTDAADINRSGNSFLVATTQQIINLNVDRQSGFVEYSLGDYTYSDLQPLSKGYLLSLTNTQGLAVALLINQTAADSSNIDKKVAQLADTEGVTSVSVYGNYIYIVPELGDQTSYNSATNTYDYDPVTKRTVSAAINQKLNSLDINRSVYKVIIPGL